ncbi:MAG: hypothetical protein V2A70_05290 [Candidatus Omnitrophota bacterium]
MIKKLLIITLIMFPFQTAGMAQTNNNTYAALLDDFALAVKGHDEKTLFSSWEKVNADANAVEYMNNTDPVLATYFRQTRTIIESMKALQEFRKHYSQSVELPAMPQWPEIPYPLSNGDKALTYPNSDQQTNQETHQQQMNNPPPDNQTVVRNLPNQSRRSNQDYIQSELNRNSSTSQ